jgi:DNA-binding XRE family transcriptional regulator
MNYGEQILAARSGARLKQWELASRLGISHHTLVDIENNRLGLDKPTYERFIAAISALREEKQAAPVAA